MQQHPHFSSPTEVLQQIYGFREFQGKQEEVIPHVIAGNDALVLMPTGGGKSLCYQIPSIVREGTGIVISPLIALMQDQVNGLTQMGVRAAYLNSSLSVTEQRHVEFQLRNNELDMLYVAPERLVTPQFVSLLKSIPLALFAIDEAHCVSQWGHDFRREYTKLTLLPELFPQVPRIALTATADGPTRKDIIDHLHLHDAQVFATGFDRPNISYTVVPKERGITQLIRFIKERHPGEAGIVYRLSRKKVDDTAKQLEDEGITALPYHAGMTAIQRNHNQERFMREEGIVMVATVAFGMGVDKPNVRYVVHMEPPKSIEAYHQETGRAGRDGLPAEAYLAYGLADVVQLRRMITPPEANARAYVEHQKLNHLLGFLETTSCRRTVLLNYFGEETSEKCGNCDTCLYPVQTWDGTVAAQKALSCVFRTGERFGVGHMADVLTGNLTKRVSFHEHNKLKTFGCGKELGKESWRSVYRQLVAAGMLGVDMEGHGGLKLNDKSWLVLKGELQVHFRRDSLAKNVSKRIEREEQDIAVHQALSHPDAGVLLERLRAERIRLAEEQAVPPYAIVGDKTLMEITAFRPRTLDEVSNMHGIGQTKLAMYGQLFLDIVYNHEAEHGRPEHIPTPPQRNEERIKRKKANASITDTIQASIDLLREKGTPDAVVQARGLVENTVFGHFAKAISLGALTLEEVVTLPEEELAVIRHALGRTIATGTGVKAAFEALGGKYSYGVLRCISADIRQSANTDEW